MKSTMLIAMTALAVQQAQAQLGGGSYGGQNKLDQEECQNVYEISDIEALLETYEDDGWFATDNCWHQLVAGSFYWIEVE